MAELRWDYMSVPLHVLPRVSSLEASQSLPQSVPHHVSGGGCSAPADAQVSKETHRGTTGRFKRWEWGKQIKESQPAYAWGRFITPLYGIKVVGFLAGVTYTVRASRLV